MEIYKNGVLIETLPDPEIEPEPEREDVHEVAEMAYINSELALALIEALEEG